ncbi:NACHT, LRR and PYD domains-containing protein 12-like isoform X2 [Colossoma macropomum]|uniref:NACHT, LRR and PYD domains-containing protein 12-like isoform X2 n=1 Tax=Colossoma macropomum TaxID=42526 RepID=UPI001864AA9E|nr:NACHT, LRR and PYD domains-containing protein 12-like isoform X2 [Colossoma macropomum]
MEDQSESSYFTSPPEGFSHRFSITAQNAGIATVPQVTGCHIGGSLNINIVHSAANGKQTQQTSAKASNSACSISERVTEVLKCNLKRKFETIFEGIAKRGNPTLLNKVYTELYITEGEREGLNKEHEVWQIDATFKTPPEQDLPISCNDIFKPFKQTEEEKAKGITPAQPRTVLTKGIAGIGKTVSVQKFILDWAEGKANQNIDLLLVLPFRELNSIKDEKQSLHELLLDFHSELKEFEDTKYYNDCKILFIFDGLDESQLPLRFGWQRVSTVSKAASLDELMTNLIDGNLLPSALVWITSRPAAIDKISPDLIHRMTEVRGFTDLQKEEYFRKRISDQSLASRIISHVRNSRTLEIMCHIPVFCWITATVLEQMLKKGHEKIPSSLTELYTRFLLIQTNEKKKKYLGERESDPRKLSDGDVQLILKLGKLAFDNLQKSKIVFSEDDLKEYKIDVTEASLRSGLFTEIFREEDPMFTEEKKYSFVHLSFQEYLAAFFVIHTYADKGVNAMQSNEKKRATIFYDDDYYDDDYTFYQDFGESDGFGPPQKAPQQKVTLYDLQKCAIDKALKSKSGHLDLFLRFLLGLSLESSQKLLKSLSVCGQNIHQTIQYLKSKLREEDDSKTPSSERCINLLHCLLELNDHSMAEEIRRFLTSGRQAEHKLTAGQCSTLAYIILMSGEVLEELDLKKYNTSEEGRRRLIPAVRNCKKAVMAGCRLTGRCCETVASALQNPNAHLRELDLAQNNLGDRDLATLHAGLNSPHFRLESLDISHINLRERGADFLRAVLMGPHVHTLKVSGCSLKDDCAEILRSAFWSSECQLRELDLGYNNLTPDGVKLVLQGLLSPNCDIQILRLSAVRITANCCTDLASVLRHSFLRELILDQSDIGDVGVKHLCSGLLSPHCQLQILGLRDCKLSKKTCFYLTVALSSYSVLKELNLGDNDLQDSGVKLLSTGLKHPNCILQNLGLSGCMITKEGCSSLASALKSNPSHLRELDLSYNHPGQSGEKLLSARLRDPRGKLNMLRLEHGGRSRITPGLWKYYQELHMDYTPSDLTCSPEGKGVIRLPVFSEFLCYDSDDEEKKEPEKWATVQSREQLIGGRFYWELKWTGVVSVGVSDKVFLGRRLTLVVHQFQFQYPYFAMHNDKDYFTSISVVTVDTPSTQRIGLLLDCPAGTLSFYSISSEGGSNTPTDIQTAIKPKKKKKFNTKRR